MSKKFSIDQARTFNAEVDIPTLSGKAMKVPFTFKALDRVELAKVYEGWNSYLKELKLKEDTTMVEIVDIEVELQTKQILDLVEGWGFDDEFTEDNVKKLATKLLGSTEAIVAAHNKAYAKLKEGN